jgi:hypothetical protein
VIDRFARIQTATHKSDVRRIAVLAVLIAAIGSVWHLARPSAVRLAAQKNLGLMARTSLIRDALNAIYPPLPENPGEQFPQSFWGPSSGSATWPIDPTMKYNGGRRTFEPARHVFVDDRLEPYGMVKAEFPFISAPYVDRHDKLVAAFRYNPSPQLARFVQAFCVVRLGVQTNEIVAIVAHNVAPTAWATRRVHFGWRDEDGDGAPEFVLLNEKLTTRTQSVTRTETLAVFRWDEQQDALRVVRSPPDGSVLIWTPPGGRPFEFPRTATIDDVCRELLPLPDMLGKKPPLAPATPSSRPGP